MGPAGNEVWCVRLRPSNQPFATIPETAAGLPRPKPPDRAKPTASHEPARDQVGVLGENAGLVNAAGNPFAMFSLERASFGVCEALYPCLPYGFCGCVC